jgi:hypothetical protein
METTDMMRVNARTRSYTGNGNSQRNKDQQHRHKVFALFDAINSGNVTEAKLALQALINYDATSLLNPQFVRLSKLLESGSINFAQQLVNEIKVSWVNSLSIRDHAISQTETIAKKRENSSFIIDISA